MAWKTTRNRAAQAKRRGKRPTTVAGEFVREEMEHIRRGKHGARSPQQAIAIGLSKARRAGVPLPPPKSGRAKPKTVRSAEYAYRAGQTGKRRRAPSARRRQAISRALKREPRTAASPQALARQARAAARRRRKRGPVTPGVRPLKSQMRGGRAKKTRIRRKTTTGRSTR